MEDHAVSLEFWQQEYRDQEKKNHNKFEASARQKLSTVNGMLHSMCEVRLKSRLDTKPLCQEIDGKALLRNETAHVGQEEL